MNKATTVVIIDHNYWSGTPINPEAFFAAFQMFKRLVEQHVPCKQIGECMIAFSPDDKEEAFSAIESISYSPGLPNLNFRFAELVPLDDEFRSWQRQQYLEAEPMAGDDQEEHMNAEDIFEMSLEKG